jgi:hypothetical protein
MNIKAYSNLSPARLNGATFVGFPSLIKVVFPVLSALGAGFFEEYKNEVSNSSH